MTPLSWSRVMRRKRVSTWEVWPGEGPAADTEAAADWLERAADAGHLGAMRRLVEVYRRGLMGQAPDPARAAHWAERYAAIRGTE